MAARLPRRPVKEDNLATQPDWNQAAVRDLRDRAARFGFASMDDALDDGLFETLRMEAVNQRRFAAIARESKDVAYRASIAGLGHAARSFLESRATMSLLSLVLGSRFELTREASCYTYYDCGDFLGVHRDRESECAATLILYLDVRTPEVRSPVTGLQLRVYLPGADDELRVQCVIPTRTRTLVIGRGARTWHERPTLENGESLAALTACFREAD